MGKLAVARSVVGARLARGPGESTGVIGKAWGASGPDINTLTLPSIPQTDENNIQTHQQLMI